MPEVSSVADSQLLLLTSYTRPHWSIKCRRASPEYPVRFSCSFPLPLFPPKPPASSRARQAAPRVTPHGISDTWYYTGGEVKTGPQQNHTPAAPGGLIRSGAVMELSTCSPPVIPSPLLMSWSFPPGVCNSLAAAKQAEVRRHQPHTKIAVPAAGVHTPHR